jgi:hypothetical protein
MSVGYPITSPNAAPILSPVSLYSIGVELAAIAQAAPASAVWPTANLAILIPVALPHRVLATKLWWYNGATVAGNVDCGVYTADGRLVISSGSTAQAGANTIQEVDITDTWISHGRYYLALSLSSTTATVFRWNTAAQLAKFLGIAQAASALPLPATLTLAAPANALIPWCGLTIAPRTIAV